MATRDSTPRAELSTPAFVGLVATLTLTVASAQLAISMIAPATHTIVVDLHTTDSSVGLAQTLFFAAAAISQIAVPIADRFGRKRALVFLLVLLIIGNVISAVAPNIALFTAGRILQGFSGACIPLALVLLAASVSTARFGKGMGVVLMANLGLAGLDTIAGGYIADAWSFRGIFVTILIIALLALLMTLWKAPEVRGPQARLDIRGLIVLGAGITLITVALSQGTVWGWGSALTLGLLIVGMALVVAFLPLERRTATPLISPELLLSRRTTMLIATTLLTLASLFATYTFTIPLLSGDTRVGYGNNTVTTALLFSLPAAGLACICAPITGRLAPRLGWRQILWVGLSVSIPTMVVMAIAPQHSTLVFIMLIIQGVFYFGATQVMLDGLGVRLSPKESPGFLPGINGACFSIGASLGIALASGFLGSNPSLTNYQVAIWVATGIAAISLATAALIPQIPREHDTGDGKQPGDVPDEAREPGHEPSVDSGDYRTRTDYSV